jgi:hypothetical protein
MFKKPFVVQTTTKVKGSDLKKIKAKILKNYAFDEDDLEEMLPPKCCKMQLDIKAFIYVTEEGGQPVFIETDRGDVFPTVFTMWNFPKVAPTIRRVITILACAPCAWAVPLVCEPRKAMTVVDLAALRLI